MLALMDDFDELTRNGARCNCCGSIKQEGDPGVFRGEQIDFEGFFDICANCIRQAASELGMVRDDRHRKMVQSYEDRISRLMEVAERVHEMEERCRVLQEVNAELVVAQQVGANL